MVIEGIELAYVNVAKYEPIKGGTYLPTPAKLESKKAIINVKNKDNECLKWALRVALFPAPRGKNQNRQSSYPVKDGINYEGIDFPTPVKQIDKLEKQNRNLAINVFGWEDGHVIVHRISERKAEKNVMGVDLMLIESGMNQHYCCVKRVSALLFDKARNNKTFCCMMCLTHFTKAHMLVEHKKCCKGVNSRPIRIEMLEEVKNILYFMNHKKQMKVAYVIYADFECLVIPIKGCERGPDEKQKSYTERTYWHLACGYSYIVVRSDGKVTGWRVYRGENAMERFFEDILQEEVEIREKKGGCDDVERLEKFQKRNQLPHL